MGGLPTVTAREVISYEEPFKLELMDFHRAITLSGRTADARPRRDS